MFLTKKMVKNICEIICENYTSNFSDTPFGPIIAYLQMHPSLYLPISNIIQCIFKIFQIIDEFPKKNLFLNLFQIQTYKCPYLSEILHAILPYKVTF